MYDPIFRELPEFERAANVLSFSHMNPDEFAKLVRADTPTSYTNIGHGGCTDAYGRRPPHCFRSLPVSEDEICKSACSVDARCSAYEWGQRVYGELVKCQLFYVGGHSGKCPSSYYASHPSHVGDSVTRTESPHSGASCWRKEKAGNRRLSILV